MSRYIDADNAHEEIEAIQTSLESNDDKVWYKNKPYYKGLAMARRVINEQPTADVVPKSDSLPLDVHEALKQRAVENAKAEVAREIFEEIEKIIENNRYKSYLANSPFWSWSYRIVEIIKGIAELKKKYTEETTDEV